MKDYESRVNLHLNMTSGRPFFMKPDRILVLKEELEEFLDGQKYMNSLTFSKNVLFSHEIKANNTVEGYYDDIEVIRRVIENMKVGTLDERKRRILNLYQGYKFILEHKEMNPDSLRDLYAVLSDGLLKREDSSRMGDYYRTAPVYILKNGRLDCEPFEGVLASDIEKYMEQYFDFIYNCPKGGSSTDQFIYSQILHFTFVYIHPYFDVNGRTSRTMAMWFLLNRRAYPYIIFNRAITFAQSSYDKTIVDVRNFGDLTYFLNYMMLNVKKELEKEYVMEACASASRSALTALDYQTLHYMLSSNGQKTVSDFAAVYRRLNEKKSRKEIFEEMFLPLVDKGLVKLVRPTKNTMYGDVPNFVYDFNFGCIDMDYSKIKRLHLK